MGQMPSAFAGTTWPTVGLPSEHQNQKWFGGGVSLSTVSPGRCVTHETEVLSDGVVAKVGVAFVAAGIAAGPKSRSRAKSRLSWLHGSRHRASAVAVTSRKACLDATGRRWETPFSKIGPEVGTVPPTDLEGRWQVGHGKDRIAFHVPAQTTAMDWNQETLCLGLGDGLVRSVDLESGSVVGDYYLGSHLPPAAISSILFDGSFIVAGDKAGGLHVWRAQLPGSWGFTHSPDWTMAGDDEELSSAHQGAVTGLAMISGDSGSHLVSASGDGVALWEPWGANSQVACAQRLSWSESRVKALCVVDGEATSYASTADGSIRCLELRKGQLHDKEVLKLRVAATSLAWHADEGKLWLGLEDGGVQCWQPGQKQASDLAKIHGGVVTSLSVQRSATSQYVFSAGVDGRAIVWDAHTGKPLWGYQGLSRQVPLALGDRSRLVVGSMDVNAPWFQEGSSYELSHNWQEPEDVSSNSPPCTAVLCADFLPQQSGDGADVEEIYWPAVHPSELASPVAV
mmetsp:Transcript_3020/g.9128  ORF Transcript_3020/g.9128 Transcript_3020/m.9128 type:complete len:511 (+) Transcript_3020:84-1616(+)|eukprot:CAMPEP_0177250954 /NCGR_PEP_ID=MMETSP0367-20130122/53683_1 /TAXON_ID=447022 ORGANISM="Scrippsiella hangoei-like, Strain SHHI-4" /NCGR_SAMPLE_ID=MMETSP0367 /ASSEMBLY_ACC=CAM_ASM_000362 /LENGTH=510 /DNA_ID=CAMNT_0018703805 /DNA_START=64 /DNA_END=1596 /DNA_ORIENTATION=+